MIIQITAAFSLLYIFQKEFLLNKVKFSLHNIMADAFHLSRRVNASVTSNLLVMDNYKKPLTMERNATLGHPSAW